MNRRKAILAMLCAVAGKLVFSEEQQQGTQGVINLPDGFGFVLDLKKTTYFQFNYAGKTVTLTGEHIWNELNQCTGNCYTSQGTDSTPIAN